MNQNSSDLKPSQSLIESQCEQRVTQLNCEEQKSSFNRAALHHDLEAANLYKMISKDRPNLFADTTVFITDSCLQKQLDIISAVESVIVLPAYQDHVLAYAPKVAQFIPKAHSVFFGYDFHLSCEGPKLIEINTNAGGALLNAVIARTQKTETNISTSPELAFLNMFLEEWHAEHNQIPLQSLAIVDENPLSQYMLPEFLLFKQLFEAHQIKAVVCDPSELVYRDQALWYGDLRIDLVYNRLTDFGLEDPLHQHLLKAYIDQSVVITPHPRAHALYADKRNLSLLTDEAALIALGVNTNTRKILLSGIAHTVMVKPEHAEDLWATRKRLFFKPAKGYGSKAAYRGDKLTKRVFSEIIQSDYVAQALVQPSERRLIIDGKPSLFKLDLRHYVYKGQSQLHIARLYQGQTTNFRTQGGGFAQVTIVSCHDDQSGLA